MPSSLGQQLGAHIVREKEAHDLSRNPEFASFQFIGYRTSAAAVELVALCDADGLTEGDIVRRRDEFFGLVRRLPHDYGLKPRGRNPNGLLGFVYADGCPESMARFIARQTRISHAAGDGGVSVAWAIDVPHRRIHTHDNPVSIFPPVIIVARTVYPGLDYLESLLHRLSSGTGEVENPPQRGMNGGSSTYNVFISYASEDGAVAEELANALTQRGLQVWLDTVVLKVGDSIRQAVDHGLANSRFGIVLLSPSFFRKPWPQHELNGLFTRETSEGRTVVLPVWHQIEADGILQHSPILADKVALRTSSGISHIADRVAELVIPPSGPAEPAPVRTEEARSPDGGVAPGTIRILFLAANSTVRPLDLDSELARIETDLRLAKERERLDLKPVPAATIDRLMQAMLDESPTIVHFSGHGKQNGIILRNAGGGEHLVSGEALASLFKLFRNTVNCVVLNACWSEPQARAIKEHIPHVIGMRNRIPDRTAIAFSTGFYKAIAARRDVQFAFEMGIARAQAEGAGGVELITLL